MDLFNQHEPILESRDALERPGPLPDLRARQLTELTPTLEARDSSSSSCSSDDSNCSKDDGGSSSTVPIVIGVVIPCLIVAIILFVLQRRYRKIQKIEDADDKYKSLDFGVDQSALPSTKKRKNQTPKRPEMSIADLKGQLRKDRGLSLDLGQANPYLLPPELHQSRESLHSLSRSMNTGDDKYRATNFIPDDGSLRSPSIRSGRDNDSTYSASTRPRFDTESQKDLLPRGGRDGSEPPPLQRPAPVAQPGGLLVPQTGDDRQSTISTASSNGNVTALRASNNYLGAYISGGKKADADKQGKSSAPVVQVEEIDLTPPPIEPQELPALMDDRSKRASSFYGNAPEVVQPQHQEHEFVPDPNLPKFNFSDDPEPVRPQHQQDPEHLPEQYDEQHLNFPQPPQHRQESYYEESPTIHDPTLPNIQVHQHEDDDDDYYDEEPFEDYQHYVQYAYRNSFMGQRPLPPDDPTENPEQRANRIRSFYKEYFEDSGKPGGQPQYYDGSENYMDDVYGYYASSGPHSRGQSIRSDGRHRAFSHGAYMGGPRAFSSMSGRMGPRQRMGPKKKLPPPKPLMTLPTPHKLKDDDFLPNAIDYAPPQLFKSQRAGTPTNPRGELRPYSPSVRAHLPLVTSFDDLAALPSPHLLRKSGTFTALDFAPPRRFQGNEGTMSETGSIRSNRSGISALHQHNIRAGAYRVSRIPKEVAGTRDDMYAALKPKWDMRSDGAVPGLG